MEVVKAAFISLVLVYFSISFIRSRMLNLNICFSFFEARNVHETGCDIRLYYGKYIKEILYCDYIIPALTYTDTSDLTIIANLDMTNSTLGHDLATCPCGMLKTPVIISCMMLIESLKPIILNYKDCVVAPMGVGGLFGTLIPGWICGPGTLGFFLVYRAHIRPHISQTKLFYMPGLYTYKQHGHDILIYYLIYLVNIVYYIIDFNKFLVLIENEGSVN